MSLNINCAAAARYEARTKTRKAQLQQVKTEGFAAVETPSRVATRRALIAAPAEVHLEGILGISDLLPVNYLDLGRLRAQSVCRIERRNESRSFIGWGTGSLVSPTLLLTNNHVLAKKDQAAHSLAEFQYEDGADLLPKPAKIFRLDVEHFFYTSVELDFTLVGVAPTALDDTPIAEFGFLPLIAESGKALISEFVSVIHHPRGHKKHVSLRNNRLLDTFELFVHYEADTQSGSSGSPVFNDQWQVVALHHAGIPKRDKAERILTTTRRRWKPEMGEDAIHWVANEGMRISSIFAHLREKTDWTAQEQALLTELGL